jgi:hypothetical protein
MGRRLILSNVMLQLLNPMYAKVHSMMPAGWEEKIDERHLSFNPLPIRNNPFEIRLDGTGLVSFLNTWYQL